MSFCPVVDVSSYLHQIGRLEMTGDAPSVTHDGPRGEGLRILVVAHAAEERVQLARLLGSCGQAGRLHEVPDATRALRLVARYAVDVAFVQVELDGVDGFDLVRLLHRFVPALAVVFVTDDTSRACEAFDVGAIDFVSPAVGADRLARSLSRALAAGRRAGGPPVRWGVGPVAASAGHGGAGASAGFGDEVRWLEAVGGDHVRVHAAGGLSLVRGPLGALVSAWSGQGVVQIHRSFAVRLAAVAEARRCGRGLQVVVDGRELPVSRRHTPRVGELLRGAGIEVGRPVGDGRDGSGR
jgi:DNA-binding LytR/AlgR family response regulator